MLQPPPLDETGKVVPHDHVEILGTDWLIRRIPPHWVVAGPESNSRRLSTQALRPSSIEQGGGLSVDMKSQMERSGMDPRTCMQTSNSKYIGSFVFQAATARSLNSGQVGWDPVIGSEPNPFHANVWWSPKLSRTQMRDLLAKSEWLDYIEGVNLTV